MTIDVGMQQAYDRVSALAAGRTMEPISAYSEPTISNRCHIYMSEDVEAVPTIVGPKGKDDRNYVFCGYKSAVPRLRVYFTGTGSAVYVGPYCRVGGDMHISGNNITVFIGAFTTIGNFTVTQWGDDTKLFIGEKGMLSTRILISNTDSHPIYDLSTGERINHDRDIRVEDHVWVARDVSINKGTVIGENSIIGQGSVVNGLLEPNSIYAGVPARQLRSGVTWSRAMADSLSAEAESSHFKLYARQKEDLKKHLDKFAV